MASFPKNRRDDIGKLSCDCFTFLFPLRPGQQVEREKYSEEEVQIPAVKVNINQKHDYLHKLVFMMVQHLCLLNTVLYLTAVELNVEPFHWVLETNVSFPSFLTSDMLSMNIMAIITVTASMLYRNSVMHSGHK